MLAAAVLAGCSAEHDELQRVDGARAPRGQAQRAAAAGAEEIRPRSPTPSAQAVEPFSTQKLTRGPQAGGAGSRTRCWPAELNRRQEPLEAYPLDSMSMVGSVNKQGQPFALLRVDNLLYQVKVGDYLGQNYGRITRIGETEIALREIVQDAAGEWIERPGTLQLQEKAR